MSFHFFMYHFSFTGFYIRHAFLTWIMYDAAGLAHINYKSAPNPHPPCAPTPPKKSIYLNITFINIACFEIKLYIRWTI